jgi:hypothetical protein
MGEHSEFPSPNSKADVLGGDEQPRNGVASRVTEDQQAASVCGGRPEQPLVVGIAADHPVENDNVGRLDGVGVDGDVVQPPPHATRKPGLAQEAFGLALVGGRELQIDAALCAPLQ